MTGLGLAPVLSVEESLPSCLSEPERLQRVAAARASVISFAGGLPDPELFPRRRLAQAFGDALRLPGSPALQYGWPEGYAQLREVVAERLRRRGVPLDAERVLITSGAQQAISIALRACLRPEATVGIDAYSYPGALDALHAVGARPSSLVQPADAYYVMPALANPEGRTMTPLERARLLAQARRSDAWILEDDAYAETVFDGLPPVPLLAQAPERVFHIGTFSKALCPGLRIGWLVPPHRALETCLRFKQANDLQANSLTQILVERYLTSGDFDGHLRRVRARYRRRAWLLARALERELPQLRFQLPRGGFSIWLQSERPIDDARLLDTGLAHGVSFDAGRPFCRDAPRGLCLRLSYSSVPESRIEEGARRLARTLAAC